MGEQRRISRFFELLNTPHQRLHIAQRARGALGDDLSKFEQGF